MAVRLDETQCGARHPIYIDVRCAQQMDAHPSWHEAPEQIVWALDAVRAKAQRRYHPTASLAIPEITVEFGGR